MRWGKIRDAFATDRRADAEQWLLAGAGVSGGAASGTPQWEEENHRCTEHRAVWTFYSPDRGTLPSRRWKALLSETLRLTPT